MCIKAYEKDGKQFFLVSYSKRSEKNPRIRVQRKYESIESREEAEKIYFKTVKDVHYLLAQKEAQGESWEGMIYLWNRFHEMYPSGKYAESTRRDYTAKLKKWTEPWLKTPAREITAGDALQIFQQAFDKGASHQLRKEIKIAINVVYKWAIDQRYIFGREVSPVYGIEVPTYSGEERGEKIPLIKTRDEIARALEEARSQSNIWYPIWFAAVHTGMRAGELNGLRREKIDLIPKEKALEFDRSLDKGLIKPRDADYGRIYVHKAWNKRAGKNLNTKSQYWRVVPVNRALYWFLVEYLPTVNWGVDEDGHRVFERLPELDRGNQAVVIGAFFEQLQLGKMTFHTLRAVWATQMLRSGVDTATVMKVGGWKDIETMMIYVRLAGIDVAGATGGLDFEQPVIVPYKEVSNGNVVQLFKK